MPPHECTFCHAALSTAKMLRRHQETAQYCLAIQGKDKEISTLVSQNVCTNCKGTYSTKSNLRRHEAKCTVVQTSQNINNGTIINNTIGTQVNQVNINVTPSRPFTMADLTKEYIIARLAPVLTKEIVKAGLGAITELIVDVLLQKDGKYCYYCTNKRDKKFTMLIDHDGQVIHEKDPNAQCLRGIISIPLQRLVGELASKHEERRLQTTFLDVKELKRDGADFSVALASTLPADSDGVPESMKRIMDDVENDPEALELEEKARELEKRWKRKKIEEDYPWIASR